jgi:conjugal transfer pilin signal peptidase TrbI
MKLINKIIAQFETGLNRQFIIKALVVSLLTVVCVEITTIWFASHYRLLVEGQQEGCLPGWNLALVDFADKTPQRNEVYTFHAKGISVILNDGTEYFKDGSLMTKEVVGMPGDVIDVGVDVTRVNGTIKGEGLPLLKTLKKSPEDYVRHVVVPPGHYFFMGRVFNSYDSRYWGFVSHDQVVGKTHRIL